MEGVVLGSKVPPKAFHKLVHKPALNCSGSHMFSFRF